MKMLMNLVKPTSCRRGCLKVERHDNVVSVSLPTSSTSTSKHVERPNFVLRNLSKKSPIQPVKDTYPKSSWGDELRGFQAGWFEIYEWLEYIDELDACLCFPCRVFLPKGVSKAFTVDGFNTWKNAMASKKGFDKHRTSDSHGKAMAAWDEFKQREQSSKKIELMVVERIPEHEAWLETVFTVVKYLIMNGQPFRGDIENTKFDSPDFGGGLYLNTFSHLLFKVKPELKTLAERLPLNAKYTSPDIQNEVFETLHTLVKQNIRSQVKKIFTIMADGSTDKNGRELLGVVVRFVTCSGEIKEHALNLENTEDRSASGVLSVILQTLEDEEEDNEEDKAIGTGGIVSQCYDGASVMSGEKGGLQKLLNDSCERTIIYIHCFCHRLSLVVHDTISCVQFVSDHFSLTSKLYDFFKLCDVRKVYKGHALKRLIDTRWSGHIESIEVIQSEIQEILACLEECKVSKDMRSDTRTTARGLHHQVCNPFFMLFNKFLCEYLRIINIANLAFQSKSGNIANGLALIEECTNNITSLADIYSNDKIRKDIQFLEERYSKRLDARPARAVSIPSTMEAFIIDSRVPSSTANNDKQIEFRSAAVQLKDLYITNMDRRFNDKNKSIWKSMQALCPGRSEFFVSSDVTPLYEYALTIPALKMNKISHSTTRLNSELVVFKNIILTEFPGENIDINKIYRFLIENYSKAAPILIILYHLAITCGFASARAECLFSSSTYIDSARRRSSTPYRECALSHLYFEKGILEGITFEQFKAQWCKKTRALNF